MTFTKTQVKTLAAWLNKQGLGRTTTADRDGIPYDAPDRPSNFYWLVQAAGTKRGIYPVPPYRHDGVTGVKTEQVAAALLRVAEAAAKPAPFTPVEGVDYSYARPNPAGLVKAGKRFAVRYVTPPGKGAKGIDQAEYDALHAAGIAVVVVWENRAGDAMEGWPQGVADAKAAQAGLQRIVGLGDRLPVYFAVDWEAQPGELPTIRAYLQGAASVLGWQRVGVYGSYRVVENAADFDVAAWFWQTYAWSGGKVSTHAHLHQYLNGQSLAGGTVDLVRALKPEYGQHNVAADTVTAPVKTVKDATIILSEPGQRIADVNCRRIVVQAAGVVIERCTVTGEPALKSEHGLVDFTHKDASGTVTDVTIRPAKPTLWQTGVLGHDYIATRVTVRHCVDGFGIYNTYKPADGRVDVTIDRCDVDQLAYYTPDPTHSDGHSHNDAVQIQGGTHITIKNSRLHAFSDLAIAQGAKNPYKPAVTGQAIGVTPNVAKVGWLHVEGCDLDGGAQPVTIIPGKFGPADLGTFVGNTFGHGGHSGRAAAVHPTMRVTIKRNVWSDGGEAVFVYTTKL